MLTGATFGLAIVFASISGSLASHRAGMRSSIVVQIVRPSTMLPAPTSPGRDPIPSLVARSMASRAKKSGRTSGSEVKRERRARGRLSLTFSERRRTS
jgi:hypothetical protein